MGDVDEWLERLGLSRYRAVFAEHDIDREILPDLTDQDLEKPRALARSPQEAAARDRRLARPDSEAQRELEAAPRAAERRQLPCCSATWSARPRRRGSTPRTCVRSSAYQGGLRDVDGRRRASPSTGDACSPISQARR